MGETLKWSPGLLYREEKTPAVPATSDVFFRYPSRLHAGGALFFTAFVMGGMLFWRWVDPADGLALGIGGAMALFAGSMAIVRIWDQRLLNVDRTAREISLLRRSPFRTRLEVVLALHLREIRITDEGDPAIRDPEREFRLHLVRMNGDRIFLGKGAIEETINLGRRLSDLLKLSLEIVPSDNLRPL